MLAGTGVRVRVVGFMVQLRQADGTTMPGVELGEIGPKLNSVGENRVLNNHLSARPWAGVLLG